MNRVLNTVLNSTPAKVATYTYGGIVALGFLRGAVAGCSQHYEWLQGRKEITIDSPLYDPVLNTCRDVGHWGFNVIQAGGGSAIIVATAPLSVPLLLNNSREKSE